MLFRRSMIGYMILSTALAWTSNNMVCETTEGSPYIKDCQEAITKEFSGKGINKCIASGSIFTEGCTTESCSGSCCLSICSHGTAQQTLGYVNQDLCHSDFTALVAGCNDGTRIGGYYQPPESHLNCGKNYSGCPQWDYKIQLIHS